MESNLYRNNQSPQNISEKNVANSLGRDVNLFLNDFDYLSGNNYFKYITIKYNKYAVDIYLCIRFVEKYVHAL